MTNKGAFYSLLLIMAAGITITTCTNYFLKGSLNTETTEKTAYEQAMDEEAAPLSEDGGVASGGVSGAFEQEKQTGMAKGRIAEDLKRGITEKQGTDQQEDEDSDAGSQEDFAMSGGALPAAGAGGNEPALASVPLEAEMSGADSMLEAYSESGVSEVVIDGSSKGKTEENAGEKKLQDSGEGADAETVILSPLETASSQKNSQKEGAVKSSYYRNRLSELDAQIQKNKENQASNNSNTNSLTQSSAASELKLWDNELNVIYDQILERMDEKQAGELVEEERQWMKERDRLAAEAAKAFSGDAKESVEYTASLAESTRLRAYELVEAYEYLLVD
ncbi:MAG: DUF1311 domain-containing protein [Hungatella sp.]|nr:DUF1311 domain-containing protein [Hungatella sp.]